MTRRASAILAAAAATGLLVLAACSNVMESSHLALGFSATGERQTCRSALGSYSLPKAMLHVKVQRTDAAVELASFDAENTLVEVVRRPDPSLVFCLDYLNSPTTADAVTVKKWPSSPAPNDKPPSSFLGAVTVNSTDQSVYIINAILRSLFILVTRDPDFGKPRMGPVQNAVVADLEFDPFDLREATLANERLRRLGYCLVLEDYMFDRRLFSVDRYCNAPEQAAHRPTMVVKAYQRAMVEPADPLLPGLMYRPRHPYRLAIYRKADPGGRGPWHLMRMTTVELENLSPVLSLDIRRAAFGARTAHFVFKEGTLLTACVSKTSELEGAVQIPLQIARGIVAVPASIIQIRVDQIKGQDELLQAQTNLYNVQKAYLEALTSRQFTSPGGPTSVTPPALALDLSMPGDLALRGPAREYGQDLFGADLKNLCEKGASS